jgi:type 1 glutamine amidotransferase
MKRTISLVLLVLVMPLAAVEEKPSKPKRPRALIITGSDVDPHDWRSTTPVTRTILEGAGGFEVFVCEDPGILDSASSLSRYDLLVLNYRNPPEARLGDAARKNLASFVESGKGLVALHFVVNAWSDWEDFGKMIGRVWIGRRQGEKVSGHGPRGTFKVRITDRESPITKGIEDFEADDELYAKLGGDTPIQVLATAHSADYSMKDEPMAWTLPYGRGRVFVTVLGHDARARENPAFGKLLAQGARWAASGEPAR